ncbi:MAG: DUF5806 family protein [Methanoregula sp.]|jgi:hypothetical protein
MDDIRAREEINKYKKFKKVDGATYRKVNQFLRKRTYITAREWALARLCTDFRTSGGAEMTFIGNHLPELVPFMEDTYSPQAVNQARNSFKKKVRKASATFFYGAMCGFFTTDELDDLLFEASEVARFLLEVEGTTLDIDEEIDIEDRITKVMRSVGEAAKTILRSRAEEGEEPSPPAQQKPLDDTSFPDNNSSPPDEKRLRQKTKDHGPASDSQASPMLFPEEILPVVDKKIALEGTLPQERSKVLPVVQRNVVQTKVFNNSDNNGN